MGDKRFHVVQVAESDPRAVEIIKSFTELDEAALVAESAKQADLTGHFDYLVTDGPHKS